MPGSYDPAQFSAVQTFKKKCESEGLFGTFDNIVEFKDKVARHLQMCLNSNPYIQSLLQQAREQPLKGQSISSRQGSLQVAKDEPPERLTISADQVHVLRTFDEHNLSEQAAVLLKTASKDKHGTILKIAVIGGRFIQAGGKTFGGGGGRESAVWEHALNELIQRGFVTGRGYKGEVFELTREGWELADTLAE